MRIDCLLARRLRRERPPLSLPSAEIDRFACVGVIDISGYTQLTDKLAALGSIDRIKDVLNPPFELIINAVHKRFGSVVKLAGDSAIVVWTIPPKLKNELSLNEEDINAGDVDKKAKEYVCNLALLCCLELLELFENYGIKVCVGNSGGGSSSDGDAAKRSDGTPSRENGRRETIHSTAQIETVEERIKMLVRKPSEQKNAIRRPSVGMKEVSPRSNEPKSATHVQKLRLHIGLGFGEVHHIFVGQVGTTAPDTVAKTLDDSRAEYFIAGQGLHDAGIMLNKGKSGQLVFGKEKVEILECWPQIREFSLSTSDEICVEIGAGFYELKSVLSSLASSYDSCEWTEEQLGDTPIWHQDLFAYIEPSLKKHLFSAANSNYEQSRNPVTKSNVFSDNMNQYRTITVLFLRLPNIPVDCLGNSKAVLEDVQFAAEQAIAVALKHGGTCRQIHADEKALSVLLVWGVEGFTHEKGDYGYAVSAGMEIEMILRSRKWCHSSPNKIDMKHVSSQERCGMNNFSLAMTMGKAFCGFIGTPSRSEGTVLGPCVNLAARVMCNEICNGRLLCDEVIAETCGRTIEFDDAGVIQAKGISGSIRLFAPTKVDLQENHTSQEEAVLEGREEDVALLSKHINCWKSYESEKTFALVVGKSGFGKSEFVKSVMRQFKDDEDTFTSFASARENRNDSNYMYQQILLSLFKQLAVKEWLYGKFSSHSGNDGTLGTSKKPTTYSRVSSRSIQPLPCAKGIFLSKLGIPRKSVVMLKASYPMIFDGYKKDEAIPEDSSSSSDSVNVLVTAIMTILGEFLHAAKQKAVICLDDMQWMDSGSFETTLDVIHRCRRVFVIMASRPKELVIDRISSPAIRNLVIAEMKKHGFEFEDISRPLLKDIGSKSQGNPMVIKLICKYLSSSPAIAVDENVLTHVHGNTQNGETIELPLDATASVISTLDKLSSTTQMVLRVASVAAQRHGILSSFWKGDGGNVDFAFHHYLIYMGIYSSLLPSRREEIHQHYGDYYEKMYESSTTKTFLPALLHHLLKVPGHEFRKIKYLREAFEVYSDWNRKIEALMYYEMLINLEEMFVMVKKTNFQLAQEQRYLALVRTDITNPQVAIDHYHKAFALIGCDMKKSNFKLVLTILKCANHVERMLKAKTEDRYIMALKALSVFAKNAFAGLDVAEYLTIATKSKVMPVEASFHHKKIFEVVEEIRTLSICAFHTFADAEVGLELAMIEFFYYFSQVAMKELSLNDLMTAEMAMAGVCFAVGKLKLAKKVHAEVKGLACDLDQAEISRQGGTVLWCAGVMRWAVGEFEHCILPYEMYINMRQKAFGATPGETHAVRVQIWMALALIGKVHDLLQNLEQLAKADYAETPILLADLKLFQAYNLASLGRFDDAFKRYDEFSGSLEGEVKAPDLRVVFVCFCRCHLEVTRLSRLGTEASLETRNSIIRRLTKTASMMRKVVNNIKTPVIYFPPFCVLSIPTWLDFILLSMELKDLKATFRKFFRAVCSMSKMCCKIFPGIYQFVRTIESDVFNLHRSISKTRLLKFVATTWCHWDETFVEGMPFLTEHWRARILVRIVRMAERLEQSKKVEVWRKLGGSAHSFAGKLGSVGMEYEAEILVRSGR
ncbi:Adenylate cyclase type 10 [Phlyctochytrium planicorne]|nr:Adenylate cyclase type 10 [Phlyctochytrium planicorne]